MSIFDPIRLQWEGKEYFIPADQVMQAIARVEDTCTADELGRYLKRKAMPLAKLSTAYGDLLRFAGAEVSNEDVYAGMFSEGPKRQAMIVAISVLLTMMVPPNLPKADGKQNPS